MFAKTNFKAARIVATLMTLGLLSTYVLFVGEYLLTGSMRGWKVFRGASADHISGVTFASVVYFVGGLALWWRPQLGFALVTIGGVILLVAGFKESGFHPDAITFSLLTAWFLWAGIKHRGELHDRVPHTQEASPCPKFTPENPTPPSKIKNPPPAS